MENYQIAILFLIGLAFLIALIRWIFSQEKPARLMSLEERTKMQKELNNIVNMSIDGVPLYKRKIEIPRRKYRIY